MMKVKYHPNTCIYIILNCRLLVYMDNFFVNNQKIMKFITGLS